MFNLFNVKIKRVTRSGVTIKPNADRMDAVVQVINNLKRYT